MIDKTLDEINARVQEICREALKGFIGKAKSIPLLDEMCQRLDKEFQSRIDAVLYNLTGYARNKHLEKIVPVTEVKAPYIDTSIVGHSPTLTLESLQAMPVPELRNLARFMIAKGRISRLRKPGLIQAILDQQERIR